MTKMEIGTKCGVCQKPLGRGQYAAQVRFGILDEFVGGLDFDEEVEKIVEKVVCGSCFIITLNMLARGAKRRK